jgi:hypothetical protein
MSKITKQELYTMVRNLENWMSDIKIDVFNQPNVTLPKSTRYDVEVGSRLDSLEARMDMAEKMLKKEPKTEPQTDIDPEPQPERQIVCDYLVLPDGRSKSPSYRAAFFDEVKEICRIGENTYLFAAYKKIWEYPRIYIGHYE